MNNVVLIGRLTKDPELSYTQSQTAVCKFTLAVDRPTRQGEEKKADYIPIVAWKRQAETCNMYLFKGALCAVRGSIVTGSYTDREGRKVYTTDVWADNVKFLEARAREDYSEQGFSSTTDAIPF